jgi:hypothetical protein
MRSCYVDVVMRACPNPQCALFERTVYSVATRCPLCKWDLKQTLPVSETTVQQKPQSAPR